MMVKIKGKKSGMKLYTRTCPYRWEYKTSVQAERVDVEVTYKTNDIWFDGSGYYIPKNITGIFVPSQSTRCVVEKDGGFYRSMLSAYSNGRCYVMIGEKIEKKNNILDMIEPYEG